MTWLVVVLVLYGLGRWYLTTRRRRAFLAGPTFRAQLDAFRDRASEIQPLTLPPIRPLKARAAGERLTRFKQRTGV